MFWNEVIELLLLAQVLHLTECEISTTPMNYRHKPCHVTQAVSRHIIMTYQDTPAHDMDRCCQCDKVKTKRDLRQVYGANYCYACFKRNFQ